MGIARCLRFDGVFRFLSGTWIDHDYDTASSSNNNNINTTPYEPRRGAEDSDGNGVTDTVKSCSQSRAETFKVASYASFSARLTHAVNSSHLAEAILSDSVKRHE
jgi:hypothetical protein